MKYSKYRTASVAFLFSRYFRLVPVMWICLIFTYCGNVLIGFVKVAPQDLLLPALLIIPVGKAGELLPPIWSLCVEMKFYLLCSIGLPLLSFIRYRSLAVSIVIVFSFLGVGLGHLIAGGSTVDSSLFPWLGFFLAGSFCFLFNLESKFSSCGKKSLVLIVALLIAVYLLGAKHVFWRSGTDSVLLNFEQNVMIGVFCYVVALICLPLLSSSLIVKSTQGDLYLGSLAYPLYLVHWLPREIYYFLRHNGFVNGSVSSFFALASMLLLSILLACLLLFFVDKNFEKIRLAMMKKWPIRSSAIVEL